MKSLVYNTNIIDNFMEELNSRRGYSNIRFDMHSLIGKRNLEKDLYDLLQYYYLDYDNFYDKFINSGLVEPFELMEDSTGVTLDYLVEVLHDSFISMLNRINEVLYKSASREISTNDYRVATEFFNDLCYDKEYSEVIDKGIKYVVNPEGKSKLDRLTLREAIEDISYYYYINYFEDPIDLLGLIVKFKWYAGNNSIRLVQFAYELNEDYSKDNLVDAMYRALPSTKGKLEDLRIIIKDYM